jgi:flagellar biosynthetic protein FliO
MAEPTLFAAPDAAAHTTAAGGTFEVTLALLLVVGVIAALAWFARRARGGLFRGRNSRIQVLATQSLGVKESAVLVRIGDTDILVGVSQGSVRPLHVFPIGANTEAPPVPESAARSVSHGAPGGATQSPNFKEMLLKSLGVNKQ